MKIGIKHYDIEKERLPNSLIIRGIVYSTLIGCLAIGILFLIPIQDKLQGTVILQPLGKVRSIDSPISGILRYQKVTESKVTEGELLATIDWDMNPEEIEQLNQLSQYSLTIDKIQEFEALIQPYQSANLIGLTGHINSLTNALSQFEQIEKDSHPKNVTEKIKREIQQQKLNIEQIGLRRNQLRENKNLLEKQYLNDLKLYNTGSISMREYEDRKFNLFDVKEKILALNTEQELINSEIQKLNTTKEEILLISRKEKSNAFTIILDELNEFQKAHSAVSSMRIIKAPINGELYIDTEYLNKRLVSDGEEVMSIIPNQADGMSSEHYILLKPRRINQIKKGQRVLISLDQFDENEFGYILSEVASKSIITDENGYHKIYFSANSETTSTKGYRLPQKSNYTGTANILLSKKSIAENIIAQLLSKKEKLTLE